MKAQADKSRSERQFGTGQWVYSKLQPYIQTSLAPQANQKLYFIFGPFLVTEHIGFVAYHLKLPDDSLIHPIFHVSQLKKAVLANHSMAMLPRQLTSLQIPPKVLQCQVITNGVSVSLQVLMQWSGWLVSLGT